VIAARRIRPLWFGLLLAALLAWAFVQSLRLGPTRTLELETAWQGLLAWLGLAERLEGTGQGILELRLLRSLTALGVGAALAYSGSLLQGVFRNSLASPSVLGVTSAASLGAALAMVALGGYGPGVLVQGASALGFLGVTASAFGAALGATLFVAAVASRGGRVSVPTLLLVGVALNVCLGGALAAAQSIVLGVDDELARAIFAWTFGNLDGRSPVQVSLVWSCLLVAVAALPFVARELDLFAGGEEDAEALGVHTGRVKLLALGAASLAAAAAVAVAGQIAFVGLVVPHLLRMLTGGSHRSLLPLSLLGGALFLLGTDVIQTAIAGRTVLQPGVLMSALGGPFFLVLLLASRREVRTW